MRRILRRREIVVDDWIHLGEDAADGAALIAVVGATRRTPHPRRPGGGAGGCAAAPRPGGGGISHLHRWPRVLAGTAAARAPGVQGRAARRGCRRAPGPGVPAGALRV